MMQQGLTSARDARRHKMTPRARATPRATAASRWRARPAVCFGHLGSAGESTEGDRKGLNAQQDAALMFGSQNFAGDRDLGERAVNSPKIANGAGFRSSATAGAFSGGPGPWVMAARGAGGGTGFGASETWD